MKFINGYALVPDLLCIPFLYLFFLETARVAKGSPGPAPHDEAAGYQKGTVTVNFNFTKLLI
jgi:hypothetical protein